MPVKSTTLTSSGSLLAAAKRLFWKHGIKRVSVEDISSEAGLSKMTFYRNFANKEAIAFQLMQNLIEVGHARFVEIMEQPEPLPVRLRSMIRMKLEYSQGISEEFLHDLIKSDDPKFSKLLEDGHKKSRKIFSHYLHESIDRGEIDPDMKVEFVLYWVDELSIKMEDETVIALFPDLTERIEHLMRFLFFGISGCQNDGQ
jgi:AcrR family transcriptional regulator